ncbi:MAG: MoxR family ATPase [Campylobacterales bacterium]|nr:MoxR family ATPase [Campylobacterales bacterium]
MNIDEYKPQRYAEQEVCYALKHNKHLLLVGETGSGKTASVMRVARALDWPCARLNMDGGLVREDLIGRFTLRAGQNGETVSVFEEGLLLRALREGHILILDEVNAAAPELLFLFQNLLEEGGQFVLSDTGERITPHERFRIFGTMNPPISDSGTVYAGVRELSPAFKNRWDRIIYVGYPSQAAELEILKGRYGADAVFTPQHLATMQQVCAFAAKWRALYKAGMATTPFTIRDTIRMFEDICQPVSTFAKAIEGCFINRLTAEELATPSIKQLCAQLKEGVNVV